MDKKFLTRLSSLDGQAKWLCRRGLLELDLILNKFLDLYLSYLTCSQKEECIGLFQESDPQLMAWLVHNEPAPEKYKEIIHLIKNYAKHSK